MKPNERNLVLPGDVVGDRRSLPGPGTKLVGDRLVAVTSGLLQSQGEKVSILPMVGAYDPRPGDLVVAVVQEANPGNWILDIRAPWLAPLHVSEAPWRVDFGETMQYLKPGDAVLCKVLFIDEQKKVQVTLKDRNLSKLEGGEIVEVPPVAVARVIGKNGSMVNLLKEYVECWMFVGQNGRIWLNGEPKEVQLAKEALSIIARESHLPGMSERVKAFLEKRKPGGIDAGLVVERSHTRRRDERLADEAADGEAGGAGGVRTDEAGGGEMPGDGGDVPPAAQVASDSAHGAAAEAAASADAGPADAAGAAGEAPARKGRGRGRGKPDAREERAKGAEAPERAKRGRGEKEKPAGKAAKVEEE
ncbi:MAG TPA: exosome complex RNA-binding protein Rrp4 [Candidatus Thermoplasmatota archaeon]|nr:exosome complex RNA-binding protein Rrp4 [Candidatus Thermoplasmatota archaeon]